MEVFFMNKHLLTLSVLLAVAGTATAMQKNQQGLVTNYSGPIKNYVADYKGGKTAVTKTAYLPDGTVLRLDPTVQWDVRSNFLKRVTPLVAPAAPVAKAAVAPAPAAPKAPTIIKPAAAPVAAAAAALKPAAPVAKPAAASLVPLAAKPAAPALKPAAPELRATIVKASEGVKPAAALAPTVENIQALIAKPAAAPALKPAPAPLADDSDTESDVSDTESETSLPESEEEVINLPTYRATVLTAPAKPAPKAGWYDWLTSGIMAPRQNVPVEAVATPAPAPAAAPVQVSEQEEVTLAMPAPRPAATQQAPNVTAEADALIREAELAMPAGQAAKPMTAEERAQYEKELNDLLGEI